MKGISRTKAVEMIETSKGRFFTVTFTKKDNTTRVMNCNYKKSNRNALGYINVYFMQDKGYRNINPQTMMEIRINNTTYKINK